MPARKIFSIPVAGDHTMSKPRQEPSDASEQHKRFIETAQVRAGPDPREVTR
jgi:hypothetical protein